MALIFILVSVFCYFIYMILARIQHLKRIDEVIAMYTQYIQLAKSNQLEISDYFIKVKDSYNESILIEAKQGNLIEEIEYYLKYYFKCPSCSNITDVYPSQRAHDCHIESVLVHGRYTKDGSLDERYNTDFDFNRTYFFKADCEHCNKVFKVEMNEIQYRTRERLMRENESKSYNEKYL